MNKDEPVPADETVELPFGVDLFGSKSEVPAEHGQERWPKTIYLAPDRREVPSGIRWNDQWEPVEVVPAGLSRRRVQLDAAQRDLRAALRRDLPSGGLNG